MFSLYDLPTGADRVSFAGAGAFSGDNRVPGALSEVAARFYERGGVSEVRSPRDAEEIVVVMQGRGRLVVDNVEHPVGFGDVVVLGPGDRYHGVADDVDPFVLLTFVVRAA